MPSLGPEFVGAAIQALVDLDTEHLEALAAAAENFRKEAAERLALSERELMETQMRLFCAVLAESRRNLHLIAQCSGQLGQIGYTPRSGRWAD